MNQPLIEYSCGNLVASLPIVFSKGSLPFSLEIYESTKTEFVSSLTSDDGVPIFSKIGLSLSAESINAPFDALNVI